MHKNKFLSLTVSLALAALALGGTSPAIAATKTVTIAVPGLPPSQGNPYREGPGTPGIHTYTAIFDALTFVDLKGNVKPRLALSWKNTSPTTWQFNLRKGVKFSNGEPFNADSVVATIDFLSSADGRTTNIGGTELPGVASAKKISDLVVEITTRETATQPSADAILPAKLSALYIVEPKAWREAGAKVISQKAIGTGPFKVDSLTTTRIELSAVKTSWRKPKSDKLVIIPLADSASRLQALQSGQVNLVASLSPEQINAVKEAGGQVRLPQAPQVMSLAFSVIKGGPVADVRVRQALNYAVNKVSISNRLLNGRGAAATQGATPLAQGYNKNVTGYPFNPGKAKQLLAAAGYANGLTLSADITVGSFPADNLIYQSVKSDLAKVGVTLNYRTVTFGQWLPAYETYSWTSDMLGLSWNTAPRGDAARPYENFVCKPKGAFYCDAAQSALLKSAGVEFDSKKRLAILKDLAVKVTASAPALYLVQQIDLYGIGKGTTGFSATNRAIAYENITVK